LLEPGAQHGLPFDRNPVERRAGLAFGPDVQQRCRLAVQPVGRPIGGNVSLAYRGVACGAGRVLTWPIPPKTLILDNLVHLTASLAGSILDIKVRLFLFDLFSPMVEAGGRHS
jgi:hypothetical protein